ncbi:MAG: MarR family transcriptional regulator [Alphaproteobacteria bacterium]|nr:MarR family transcriptional regulator [Alphaproteobacteria bacterium]MBV9694926.1 MarR family transcriptional regulator [Alphaproteobacteria bacterium]
MDVDHDKLVALAGFRAALRRFLAFSEEATIEAGITSQQYQALLAIGAAKGAALTLGALAQELLLKANAAVQLVDRLAAQDLVTRTRDEGDRRSVRIALTPKGRALLVKLAGLHLDQLSRRKKQFADILRRLKQTQAD